ncbi:S9 family peptidase [Gloeothece verrucosa]|uniref:Peptidase S9 prolyl oligopeptidase active site domain protein n=1 Tax=Gloeothece verrucosa (strain PCC 7822) TaxID=497965 RepID=E0U526_GLOV7|nr:S9 family peptidase [Gloeothece verrucosa]ADN12305.1 peptidase S9 prolyl oligopeptidase active site domain protein [Gloeothece verrucosa PCC 7822]
MTNPQTAPYGSWKSPITSDLIVAGSIGLGNVILDGEDIYWLEARPTEGGRNVLVKLASDGTTSDITPQPYNVRTRVHEYGGGSCIVAEGTVYFSNFVDGRLYKQLPNREPQPLTAESKRRYADAIVDSQRSRLICVCEDHSNSDLEPENSIISIDINTGDITTLVSGSDFYSSPRLSPDGLQLAWLSWNHPNLPWDETELSIASVQEDGTLKAAKIIAGGENESICEPKWSEEGQLYFSSDRTGWWNLYRYHQSGTIDTLCPLNAEFAYPHWVFGISTYTLAGDEIYCTYTQNGRWYLAQLNPNTGNLTPIDTPCTEIGSLKSYKNTLVFIGGSPTQPNAVIKVDLNSKQTTILKQSTNLDIDLGYISIPEVIAFPTEGGLTAYAWYYPPTNKDYIAPDRELPPLLVKSHGGPTACATANFSLRVQYWTSRGFAYLDVNYGGSTGFGREYRQRLDKNWGIVDVDDCINAAKYLVQQGKADGKRLAISGGSAGGYTTLAALTFRNVFQAGASYYGVSDLEALAKDTHKFESRYLDRLIGQYPQEKDLYQQRSPIMFTDRLDCPVIFFQGLEDKVVPPNQAEMMVAAIKTKGLPVAYVPFEGEQHGFRRAENIKRALDGEFYFYSRIFGFTPADSLEPVAIENLA